MRTRIVCTAGGLALLLVVSTASWGADDPPPSQQSVATASEQPAPQAAAQPAAPSDAAVEPSADKASEPAAPRPLRHGVFRWTSYPAAWTAAQKTNRPILMFITSPGCPHCVKMISQTFQAPHISPLVADSFEAVYIDRATQPELVAKLKVRWFPTTIVVGTNNKVIDVLEGYVDPLAFNQRLKTGLAATAPATQTR